jgi:hypothetical protein
VELDDEATAWLAEIWEQENVSLAGPLGNLEAWLAWEDDSNAGRSGLAVHLGQRRVGAIPPPAIENYQRAMDEATFLEEIPFGRARITRHRTGFVLKLTAPGTDGD